MNTFRTACSLLLLALTSQAQTATSLADATNRFLATLTAEERQKTTYAFDDTLRRKWTNLPVGLVPRAGIRYGSLSDTSRLAFHRVLTTLLSSRGYLKTTHIMQLDDVLNALYQDAYAQGKIDEKTLKMTQNLRWAHGNYFISVWGQPGASQPWGLNFGGHHVALNVTAVGHAITASPFFYGTDPAEVKSGKYAGLRVLSKEEDYGFRLVNMLAPAQRAKAVLTRAVPKDIITSPQGSQRITEYAGLAASAMTPEQREMLKLLVGEYLHNFEHEKAHQLFDRFLKTGLARAYFAWIGALENNRPHYYVVHTPDFLIEYDNVGFQDDGNHIHAILREKGQDFGDDLLKQHYLHSHK
jgi:hypothetical protein